jgi:putative oxidoreductase
VSANPVSLPSPIGWLLLASIFLLAESPKVLAPTAATYATTRGDPASAAFSVCVGVFEPVTALPLLLGCKPPWSALVLALFMLVASFWLHACLAAPAELQTLTKPHFSKNIAIVGALLFIAGVGPGPRSLDNRVDKEADLQRTTLARR